MLPRRVRRHKEEVRLGWIVRAAAIAESPLVEMITHLILLPIVGAEPVSWTLCKRPANPTADVSASIARLGRRPVWRLCQWVDPAGAGDAS